MKFEPLVKNRKTISYYVKHFQNVSLRKILYATTPKTKKEIFDWLTEITNRPDVCYFNVLENNRLVGHIGLDDPDYLSRSIRLGCFLANTKLWPKYGPEIFKFIIAEAQKRNWKLIYCDVAGAEPTQIAALESIGFRKNLNKPSILIHNLL